MYDHPFQMQPLFPTGTEELEDLALQIFSASATLGGQLHPLSRQPMVELLRIMNSYYSNRLEGHHTHPVDIEKAMRQDYALAPVKRALQMESCIHIQVQRQIEQRLATETSLNVADSQFLSWIHQQFYLAMPETLKWVSDPNNQTQVEVKAGQLRNREVQVGRHLPPRYDTLPLFLNTFSLAYSPRQFHGANKLIAAAASHQRLMWIHPFLDGNGRVARLFSDAYLGQILSGYGLWTVSRGLARQRDDYLVALTWGDAPRQNDYDGRGNLSNQGLLSFCRFFLETCLDQITFMQKLLQLDALLERIRGYVAARHAGLLPFPPLRPEAADILQAVLLRGELSRGEAQRMTRLPERTARNILKQLLTEGLLVSPTTKGVVRLGMPATVAYYWLPQLYSEPLE
jgi:Fic family protein